MPVPVVAAVRSPFALADGVLAGWHPVDLAADVANAALHQAGLAPADLDHVWVGCDEPVGAQGANVARAIALSAGWPDTVGGTVVEAAPHSGLSALAAAVDAITAGRCATAMVIGVSSSSLVQPGASALARTYGRPWGDGPADRYADDGGLVPPIVAADRAAAALGIDRAAQDRWGLRSIDHRTAAPAIHPVGARPGESVAVQRGTPVDADESRVVPIDDLEPIFDPDGTTTAISYAPAADGVSVLVLGDGAAIGQIDTVRTAAGSPFDPAAPAAAVIGEPPPDFRLDFAANCASAVLVALHTARLDPETVDVDGGTIATGDAFAAEDLRPIVDGLRRDDGADRGMSIRVAAGAAAACVWQRL